MNRALLTAIAACFAVTASAQSLTVGDGVDDPLAARFVEDVTSRLTFSEDCPDYNAELFDFTRHESPEGLYINARFRIHTDEKTDASTAEGLGTKGDLVEAAFNQASANAAVRLWIKTSNCVAMK